MAYKKRKDKYTIVDPQYSTSFTVSPYGQYATMQRPAPTSFVEIRDIIAALLVLTVAFSWIIYSPDGKGFFHYLGFAAVIVVAGFFVHEMSHKIAARRYGCWAEFRADYRGLGLVLVTAFFGFLFAAPGAVWIRGNVTRSQNGKISLAGPGSNIVVSVACVALLITGAVGTSGTLYDIAYRLLYFNAFLAAFNMIPVMPFDGSKIWQWNKPIYIAALVAAGLLFYLGFTGL
ncbi:MAG: site-2 protease family protein [Candidatus Thermoplasmatota archaeon]|nr:site-2 protease family protein [Candidatus Thermoplasmatota archaeon]